MNLFKHMSVKWKIYLIAVVSICGFGAYLGYNVWVNTRNAQLLSTLREAYFPILDKATQNDVNLDRLSELFSTAAMTAESEYVYKAQTTADNMNDLFDQIERLEPTRKADIVEIKKSFNDYYEAARDITLDMLSAEADMSQMAVRAEIKETKLNKLNTELDAFIAYARAQFSGSIDTANANSRNMLTSGFVIWGVCILLMAVTVYAIARIILGNINQVSSSLAMIAQGSADFSRKIVVTSEDEIGKLAASFNALMENLRVKTNDLMCMMQHMHSGLFTITQAETIHGEYSACLEDIFETNDVADKHYFSLLFDRAQLGVDVSDQLRTAVSALLGEDAMMFEFNSHLLIKEYQLTFTDDHDAGASNVRTKIIELDWDAIVTDDIITKIMVTVRDVTEVRAMQAAAEEQKRELEMVGQILKLTPDRFSAFAENALSLLEKNALIIRQHPQAHLPALAELFANMHTIKGNARTYQLTYLTDIVHATESTYDRLRKDCLREGSLCEGSLSKDSSAEWSQMQLLEELGLVRSALDRYVAVLKEKLSFASDSFASPQGAILIDKEEYRALLRKIEPLVSSASQASPMLRLLESLQQLDARPLTGVLGGLVKTLPEVARQLGKPEPKILIHGEDVRVFSEYANTITNVFSHVLKNSIDHGLEKAEQRVAARKPEAGIIHIQASQQHVGVEIEVWDDGRGLALKRLHKKMTEEGLLAIGSNSNPQRVAESIFMSGLSTAEAVTDISGRGVGMDAVKKYLNACGCDIKIVLTEQATLERDYVPFKLVISLSPNVCFIPGVEKQSGAMSCHNNMQKVS